MKLILNSALFTLILLIILSTTLTIAESQDDVDTLFKKGLEATIKQKYDEAIQYFDKVLEIDPNNAIALSNKKIVLNRDVSYSVTQENKDKLSIFVQIQIRNSVGQLVGYIESDRIRIPDLELIGIILDTTTVGKPTFTQNGQNFVRNEISSTGEYDGDDTVISKTGYIQGNTWLFYADHDGYPLVRGDQTITLWTVIRPNL